MILGYSHVIRNVASSDLQITRRDSQCENVSYVILIIQLMARCPRYNCMW